MMIRWCVNHSVILETDSRGDIFQGNENSFVFIFHNSPTLSSLSRYFQRFQSINLPHFTQISPKNEVELSFYSHLGFMVLETIESLVAAFFHQINFNSSHITKIHFEIWSKKIKTESFLPHPLPDDSNSQFRNGGKM